MAHGEDRLRAQTPPAIAIAAGTCVSQGLAGSSACHDRHCSSSPVTGGPSLNGTANVVSCFHQTLKKYLQAQDRPGVGSGIVSPDASAGGRFRSGEGLRPWTSMPSTRTVTKVSLVSSIVGCSLP